MPMCWEEYQNGGELTGYRSRFWYQCIRPHCSGPPRPRSYRELLFTITAPFIIFECSFIRLPVCLNQCMARSVPKPSELPTGAAPNFLAASKVGRNWKLKSSKNEYRYFFNWYTIYIYISVFVLNKLSECNHVGIYYVQKRVKITLHCNIAL